MIVLLNPTSARWKHRFPLSLMFVGAVLEGRYPYRILDQNIKPDVLVELEALAARGVMKYLGITVMPGPQLHQAIPISKRIKDRFPGVTIIWGGYFSTLHASTVLKSGYVDFVILGPGEHSFLELIQALESGSPLSPITGLGFRENGSVTLTGRRAPSDPNQLPSLPYDRIEGDRYVGRTYLGSRTAAYYSSVGCPFLCGFCAVASIYRARWLAREPGLMLEDMSFLQQRYGVNGIEFFDENFFTSEARAQEFSRGMIGRGISWWAEGRPDTVLEYSNETLKAMRDGGCRMIFFGAESASAETLEQMNKGGTQTPETVLRLAERLRPFGIIPEFSFVFGSPSDDVDGEFRRNIAFIRKLKRVNPSAEIILYLYAPVVFEESELYHIAQEYGFRFPATLDEWASPRWQTFDLRKTPVIPWLGPRHYRQFRNFERVLHGYYPTISDLRLTRFRRRALRLVSSWRYHASLYTLPIEVQALQRAFRYRQPEIEGL